MTLMKLRSRNLVPEAGDIGRQYYEKVNLRFQICGNINVFLNQRNIKRLHPAFFQQQSKSS